MDVRKVGATDVYILSIFSNRSNGKVARKTAIISVIFLNCFPHNAVIEFLHFICPRFEKKKKKPRRKLFNIVYNRVVLILQYNKGKKIVASIHITFWLLPNMYDVTF